MKLDDEERLRKEFTKMKEHGESWDLPEDPEEAANEIYKEMNEKEHGFNIDEWNEIIAKDLGIFEEDKYQFNKDMKSAYHRSLRSNTEDKIFETIPDHYFWDIKTPQMKQMIIRKNRYNPFRGREFDNFFDMRASEEYMTRVSNKKNINDSVSIYRRY